ncbi:MAG: TonB-dependent receptor [Nannocystaceae bacterium]
MIDVEVRGRAPAPPRAASDLRIDGDVLRLAPKQSAGEMMSTAPGVYVARPEGDAVAHEIILRGFDAAHGQDIELTIGALPLNQISHLHGQGYADLGIILPEVVRSMRVREGVYDPRQGDFAVAGSIDFDLGVVDRGTLLRSQGGSFGTFRQLVLFAPKGQDEQTFAAAAIRRSSGFGQNRGGLSGVAIGQFVLRARDHVRITLHAAAMGARAGMAGVLRRDDVERGVVGFYDAYDDPSARSQSASSGRGQAMIDVERRGDHGERTRLALWSSVTDLRLRQNFTGYLQRGMVMPEWVGRGDLIEQHNADVGGGFLASHRTRTIRPTRWLGAALELGTSARLHRIDQAQNLLQAPNNETWDQQVDARIRAGDVGVYGDLEVELARRVVLRGGGRADVLHYDIDDRLGNYIAPYQVASHLVGYRRTALGVAAGPRASVEIKATRWLQTFLSYGTGYRSPQARLLDEGERAPFAKVRSAEGGVRASVWGQRIVISGAGFATFLSSDLAFDPGEGRLEKIGPTQRSGLTVHALARPLPWLVAAASVTYVHAVLTAPPPATAEDPAPAFTKGQLLPYVPPVVIRADVGLDRAIARPGGRDLALRVGAPAGLPRRGRSPTASSRRRSTSSTRPSASATRSSSSASTSRTSSTGGSPRPSTTSSPTGDDPAAVAPPRPPLRRRRAAQRDGDPHPPLLRPRCSDAHDRPYPRAAARSAAGSCRAASPSRSRSPAGPPAGAPAARRSRCRSSPAGPRRRRSTSTAGASPSPPPPSGSARSTAARPRPRRPTSARARSPSSSIPRPSTPSIPASRRSARARRSSASLSDRSCSTTRSPGGPPRPRRPRPRARRAVTRSTSRGSPRASGASFAFVADVDLPPKLRGSRAVEGVPLSAALESDALRLTIDVDAGRWIAAVDFQALADLGVDPVVIDADSPPTTPSRWR